MRAASSSTSGGGGLSGVEASVQSGRYASYWNAFLFIRLSCSCDKWTANFDTRAGGTHLTGMHSCLSYTDFSAPERAVHASYWNAFLFILHCHVLMVNEQLISVSMQAVHILLECILVYLTLISVPERVVHVLLECILVYPTADFGTRAGGPHPTGMHSCPILVDKWTANFGARAGGPRPTGMHSCLSYTDFGTRAGGPHPTGMHSCLSYTNFGARAGGPHPTGMHSCLSYTDFGTRAGGPHPTGMHSCPILVINAQLIVVPERVVHILLECILVLFLW